MSDDAIFPIIDRRTPVIDRLRNGREEEEEDADIFDQIAESVKSDFSSVEKKKLKDELSAEFAEEISNRTGVPIEGIKSDAPNELAEIVVDTEIDDLLTESAMVEMGFKESVEDTETSDDVEEEVEEGEGEEETTF